MQKKFLTFFIRFANFFWRNFGGKWSAKKCDFPGMVLQINPGPSANERGLKNKLPEAFRRAFWTLKGSSSLRSKKYRTGGLEGKEGAFRAAIAARALLPFKTTSPILFRARSSDIEINLGKCRRLVWVTTIKQCRKAKSVRSRV